MKVTICMGAKCTLMGANSIYDAVERIQDEYCESGYSCKDLEIEVKNCLNYCKVEEREVAPVVIINDEVIYNATAQVVSEKILNGIKE